MDCLALTLDAVSTCSSDNTTCICTDGDFARGMHACADQTCTIKQALTALNITATMFQRPVRDRSLEPMVIASVSGSVAALSVLLRTLDALLTGRFAWDDACALGAGLTLVPMNAMLLRTASVGLGRDTWTLPFDDVTYIQKLEWLGKFFYWPTTALSRLAFLLMYFRMFPKDKIQTYTYTLMALTTIYWIIFQFSIAFHCKPISMVWKGWDGEQEGECWDINRLILSGAGVTVFLHAIIMLLPVPALYRLSMFWRKKWEVLFMFTVGIFILAVSCLRISSIINYAKSLNPTWDNAPADYWSVLEANSSVFCVCMPALHHLVVHRLPCFNTNGPHDTPSEDAPVQDKPMCILNVEYNDAQSITSTLHRGENGETIEYPWERTTAPSEQSPRPSHDTVTFPEEADMVSHERAAELECIELCEGPAGEQVLLRRGINDTEAAAAAATVPSMGPAPAMPGYEDDD
ncbi:uncharacterized protein SETTUDRAFT_162727 [Exserohilum turcica Et28A]|uniref:Extracellular membrane protein CFEM domain-containing protein n=1 Tax=Exserohilum turcicum (strain 28A) TaxID=671987 RepID=R0J5W2_EXST2|nr:uncharacterized protein SETTUDRAFT_162727 [Exserohilum turcica Et28A]EOA92300.1 hypothetical protein SETTUDRAFT_162727 [Exserohilum turcica Et28A]